MFRDFMRLQRGCRYRLKINIKAFVANHIIVDVHPAKGYCPSVLFSLKITSMDSNNFLKSVI